MNKTLENKVIEIGNKPKRKLNRKKTILGSGVFIATVALLLLGGWITRTYYPPQMPTNQQCALSQVQAAQQAKVFANELSEALKGKSATAPNLDSIRSMSKECVDHINEYNMKLEAK